MTQVGSKIFQQVWLVDFEFIAPDGERPKPVVCMVAKEMVSGKTIRLWEDQLKMLKLPPYSIGRESLFVAYYASAEFNCHLALGWPLPENVLDLFTEFRCITNGKPLLSGGLLGALAYFGLPCLDAVEKDPMRNLILSGGPWSQQEKQAILNYCQSDVIALEKLLPSMAPHLDIPLALLRGRYMKAAANIEFNGAPIDVERLDLLRNHWNEIQDQLILEIDADYGVFEGRTFKRDKFAEYLVRHNIPWPRHDSGNLDLSDDTFKEMARSHSAIAPLRELRTSLSKMRLKELAVGSDGRNRCILSAFRAKTSRNQPALASLSLALQLGSGD